MRISWNARTAAPTPLQSQGGTGPRCPNRIGWSVVERGLVACRRPLHFMVHSRSLPGRGLPKRGGNSGASASRNKRRHELALLAKRLTLIARHHQAHTVVTERLRFGSRDHGRGRSFNRLINQCWFRRALLQPLLRRLDEGGFAHTEINPAYSSLIGNYCWAVALNIPDPACAALELGRRFLCPLRFTPHIQVRPPKQNGSQLWKDGRRASEHSGTLGTQRVPSRQLVAPRRATSSSVERELPKLERWVRFPRGAPLQPCRPVPIPRLRISAGAKDSLPWMGCGRSRS